MAKMMGGRPKYTHGEWVVSNDRKYAAAEGQRAACERLEDHIADVISDTKFITSQLDAQVNRKFDEREGEVKFLEGELERKTSEVNAAIDDLVALDTRLSSAIQSMEDPLRTVKRCLALREERVGVDVVRDAVEMNLEKEAEVCEGVIALLSRSQSQLQEQTRLLRKTRYNLEGDLKDKYVCLSIDEHARQSNSHSSVPAQPKQKWSSWNDWQRHSDEGLKMAEGQRSDAIALRSLILELLSSTYEDLQKQHEQTLASLRRRIFETKDANSKLQEHLALVREEMGSMEMRIEELEDALDGTRQPLKQAVNRMQERSTRPNVERCLDSVQSALERQATGIQQSAHLMETTLATARKSLVALRSQHVTLEDEIKVKMKSVEIDEMQCATLVSSIHFQPF